MLTNIFHKIPSAKIRASAASPKLPNTLYAKHVWTSIIFAELISSSHCIIIGYSCDVAKMEAASLSSITEIASNPPLDASMAVSLPRSDLVLYIARVPGSRDVFLTTMKPRDRVVTAEDVQSSLYYVHINCQEDDELAREALVPVDTDGLSLDPPAPKHSQDNFLFHGWQAGAVAQQDPAAYYGRSSVPHPLPPIPPGSGGIARKPVGSKVQTLQGARPQHPIWETSTSHPLPKPPTEERSGEFPAHRKALPNENSPAACFDLPTGSRGSSEEILDRTELGTLTLIRRDPSSGEQWNVATIRDTISQEPATPKPSGFRATRHARRSGLPLSLDVTNPAYVQFTSHEVTRNTATTSHLDSEPKHVECFRRRLYLPGTVADDRTRRRDHRSDSANSFRQNGDYPYAGPDRHSVDMATKSTASALSERRSKGYSFTSPWDTLCEFSTGASGKSLKCRHQVPGQSGTSNLEVSELRFNLPTASRSTPSETSEKRSSYFHGIHKRFGSFDTLGDPDATPTFAIDENGRIDLTLGKERAGGGFGGRQAKLGKLIVRPEGLKMLDLLVSANIGLWWRAYERA